MGPDRCYLRDATEAYGNLGNALKELGDLEGAVQFYLKVCACARVYRYTCLRWHMDVSLSFV